LTQDVRRLDRLVTDISNASRLDAELARDTPSPLDLVNLLIETCGAYRQRKKLPVPVVLTVPKDTRDVLIQGREGPLAQVFRNLIDNAQSFSPSTGQVRLKVELLGAWIDIQVDDDGPGIPPESLETIFERFYTSRPKGAVFGSNSGLGLSIARQIIQAHGGALTASNRTATDGTVEGARFVVRLPVLEVRARA